MKPNTYRSSRYIRQTAGKMLLAASLSLLVLSSPLSADEAAKPDLKSFTTADASIFTDKTFSALKKGTTDAQIQRIQDPFLRQLASSIKDGSYDLKRRLRTYEAYETVDTLKDRLKTSGYSQFENPTGIYFEKGEPVVLIVGGLGRDKAILKIRDFGSEETGEDFDKEKNTLKNGVNIITAGKQGLAYISYYSDDYKKSPKVKIHILSGKVNGVFDSSVCTDEDWKKMLDNAACEVIDIVGRHVHLVYPVEQLKEACPERGLELTALYDQQINMQHEIMGLIKYKRQPKNRMFGRVSWKGFMFADGMGAGFGKGVIKEIGNPDNMKKGSWGVAHEFGHVNQTRPGMKWVSTTEVTNNIFSQWAAYKLNPTDLNLEHQVCKDEDGNRVSGGRFVSFLNSAIVNGEQWLCQKGQDKMQGYENGGDHFVKLCPLWQLQLYFAVAKQGNPDFYPDIFEIVRNTDEKGVPNGQLQINFMKNACDVTRQDLTDFFKMVGMLKPIDKDMDDYSRAQLTITQEDCDKLVKYASKYPKPASPVIYYISAHSVNAYKNKLPVEGEFGKGVEANDDHTLTVEHNVWKNAAVFETYKGDELLKIAMAGTSFKDNSATLVRYPEGATRVEAVAWDGKRTLVYGAR